MNIIPQDNAKTELKIQYKDEYYINNHTDGM